MSELVLSDLWQGLHDRSDQTEVRRHVVLDELRVELAPGHGLSGRIARVVAFFLPADDVIVELVDGGFALVHPTWSGQPEKPPWPSSHMLGDASTASEAVAAWEMHWR